MNAQPKHTTETLLTGASRVALTLLSRMTAELRDMIRRELSRSQSRLVLSDLVRRGLIERKTKRVNAWLYGLPSDLGRLPSDLGRLPSDLGRSVTDASNSDDDDGKGAA